MQEAEARRKNDAAWDNVTDCFERFRATRYQDMRLRRRWIRADRHYWVTFDYLMRLLRGKD